ncbi:MAG: universal stress protein [Chitinophagaceae bacterium]|nr:universal stress protein [Chitinophagaceae bacterium]
MNNTNILVPTDFTKVADCAVDHAINLASLLNGQIVLLHVIEKENEEHEAKLKLEGLTKQIFEKYKIEVDYILRVGNIFDDIGAVAKEIDAKLIIMGTHGAKGMQKLFGSYAIKVITNSEVPFVVVQQRPIAAHGYKKILLPIEATRETKHKIQQTIYIARYFNSQILLIGPKSSDETFVRNLRNNMAFTEASLKEEGIPYSVHYAETKNFTREIMDLAITENADLIAIVNEQKSSFFSPTEEQDIIANEAQIPVLCVNPANVTIAGGILGS